MAFLRRFRCPNCGRKSKGDYCQWCGYPLMRGKPVKKKKVKQGDKKLEKAGKGAEEAKKVKEAEKRTKRIAEKTRGKVMKLASAIHFPRGFWRPVTVTRGFLVVGLVIFIIALVGVFVARALPDEIEEHVTLLNYTHKGNFDYLAYLKPSYLYGPTPPEPLPPNPQYLTQIIDSFDLTYRCGPAGQVTINAFLENPGIWQKKIYLVPKTSGAGTSVIDFSLDLDELFELTDTIAEEIGISASTYDLTIRADVSGDGVVFTHTLPMELSKTLIEVDRNLSYTDDSGNLGKFDYVIHLKENSIYWENEVLKPPVIVTEPSFHSVRSGETIFTELLDRMLLTFTYRFKSDKPVTQLTEEVQINAVLENPNFWSKEFVLVPPTQKSGDFNITIPLDIDKFTEVIELIQGETGVSAAATKLTIKADVHTVAETDFGTIDEDFSQTLTSTLGRGVLDWEEELESSIDDSIEESRTIPNLNKYLGLSVDGVRNLSVIIASIIFVLFLYSVVLYIRFKPVEPSEIEKEARRARKKYKDLIVDIRELPEAKAGETIILLTSLDDLITAAEELLKPVLHKAEAKKHIYCAIDGLVRYEYVSELELPDTK